MLSTIKEIAVHNLEGIVSLRRFLHQNPELSFKEFSTTQTIAEELQRIGVKCYTFESGVGVIGVIEGEKSGITIGIRAELDALPVDEKTNLPFASSHKNVMHACGHDVHMASLVGAAKILMQIRSNLIGKVLLIFQPGEELLPGGALDILESPVFKENRPDIMIGMHILPELQAGMAGFKSGPYMASGDEIYLTVQGKGGHAALPAQTVNPILIASNIIVAMQQMVESLSNEQPVILSFGKVMANGATNVIPDFVSIEGTLRTTSSEIRELIHSKVDSIAKSIASTMNGNCQVDIRKGYPSLSNNPEITERAVELAQQYLGKQNVVDLPIRMTTDDFARYAQQIPSVYFRIGSGFQNQTPHSLHSGTMVVNEYVLEHSAGLLAWLAYGLMSKNQDFRFL
jgi:amidohydrolase